MLTVRQFGSSITLVLYEQGVAGRGFPSFHASFFVVARFIDLERRRDVGQRHFVADNSTMRQREPLTVSTLARAL
jgi:hypothetical protein